MSAFREHPHRDRLKLLIRPPAQDFLRQINMDFFRSPFSARSNPSESSIISATNPTPTVALEAFLVGDPLSADEGHGFLRG
jgi:hypothetical protein